MLISRVKLAAEPLSSGFLPLFPRKRPAGIISKSFPFRLMNSASICTKVVQITPLLSILTDAAPVSPLDSTLTKKWVGGDLLRTSAPIRSAQARVQNQTHLSSRWMSHSSNRSGIAESGTGTLESRAK
jgi:hypothetical protein